MKEKIHPEFYEATISCICGHSWKAGSTKKELKLDVCSNCHPYYTGKQKLLDTEGRIDRFNKKYAAFNKTATK